MRSSSKPQTVVSETEITLRVGRYLKRKGWHILALHYPGAQGGLAIHSVLRKGRGSGGSLILDFVARKGRSIILGESKARFSEADARKLAALIFSPAYAPSLASQLGVKDLSEVQLIPALACAFAGVVQLRRLEGFLIFLVFARRLRIVGPMEVLAK